MTRLSRASLFTILFISLFLFGTIQSFQLNNHSGQSVSIFNSDFHYSQSDVSLTYRSNDNNNPRYLSNHGTATGDHVVITASADSFSNPESISMEAHFESTDMPSLHVNRSLVIPEPDYDPFTGIINSTQFDMIAINNLEKDYPVYLEFSYTNTDCIFMVWSGDTNPASYQNSNNILNSSFVIEGNPTIVRFNWNSDTDRMIVACFNSDGQEGSWSVNIDQNLRSSAFAVGSFLIFDTYDFGRNVTVSAEFVVHSFGGDVTFVFESVTFNNFFKPYVMIESPAVGATYTGDVDISWTVSDTNIEEMYTFDILLSADGGDTFQLLSENFTSMRYIWDSSGFLTKSTYAVMVRVYDSGGLNSTGVSPLFSAGDVNSGGGPRWPPSETTTSELEYTESLMNGIVGVVIISSFTVLVLGTIYIFDAIRKKSNLQAKCKFMKNTFALLLLVILLCGTPLYIQYHINSNQESVRITNLEYTATGSSLTIVSPIEGDVYLGEVNISWIISNTSAYETYTSEVLLSKDSGETFQLLNTNITRLWYIWDTSEFLVMSTYSVMVRVFASGVLNSTAVSPLFTAGDIISHGMTPKVTDEPTNFIPQILLIGFLYGATIGLICLIPIGTIFIMKTKRMNSIQRMVG